MSTRFFKLPGRGRKPGTEASAGALLTDRQHQLIEQELALLARSGNHGPLPGGVRRPRSGQRAAEQLTSLFLLVIVGEFNAGKSAFINALVGAEVMPEGVTPTTPSSTCCATANQSETMLADGIILRDLPGANSSTKSPSSIPPAPTPSSASTRR